MRTAAVDDNVLFIALTTHILHSYRTSLSSRDRALFVPHTRSSSYSPGHHGAAAALLRTYNVRDALKEDFDELAAAILPASYGTTGQVRGALRGSGAVGYAVPLTTEEGIAVQVYAAYRRAKKELADCLESIVAGVLEGFQGTGEEKRVLRGQLRARSAVDVQREVLQVDMDATERVFSGVERLGYDARRDRVVFFKKVGGMWVEM
ncbi:hypothetical protein DFP73DRAFT_529860 [Morchella snyderi]|nr:hypothetical protein DFP73DRAFT_529860 [Morchella snyderi]